MTRHLTAAEKRARASAEAAVARALAHTRPPPVEDDDGFITPARARAIRLEIEETRDARIR